MLMAALEVETLQNKIEIAKNRNKKAKYYKNNIPRIK